MDRSLNGGDNATKSSVAHDRPPRSPIRAPSRTIPFTRSRAFPSIRRRTIHETNRLWLALYACVRVIWVVASLGFLYSFWRSARSLIWSKSQVSSVGLSDFPSIVKAPLHNQATRSRRIESITAPASKQERIKLLLNILHSSQNKSSQWPSFIKLHQVPSPNDERRSANFTSSCIVTAYFRTDSKHKERQYDLWMQNMLSMQDCMVIFCEADLVDRMIQYRSQSSGPTAILEVPLEDLPISSYYYDSPATPTVLDFWHHQFEMDPEKEIHRGYEVFWIWLSKSWFVSTAALLQHHLFASAAKNSGNEAISIWMWADIGSFRDKRFSNKKLLQHVKQEELFPNELAVVWMAHRKPNPPLDPFWNRKLLKKEKNHFYHSGSHAIASTVKAWTTFHEHFVNTLDDYATKELFLGEDQCVLQTTCLLYPESCVYIPSDQVHDNNYFGLRHVVHHGPNDGKKWNLPAFQLWRPPLLNASPSLN